MPGVLALCNACNKKVSYEEIKHEGKRTVWVAEQRKFRISSTVARPSGTRLPRCLRSCVRSDAFSCN